MIRLAELFLKHNATPIKCIKIHIKRIHDPISLIHNNYNCRLLLASRSVRVGLDALEPLWVGSNINIAGEINIAAGVVVQFIEIGQSEWRGEWGVFEANLGTGVAECVCEGGGFIGVFGIQVN